MLCQLFDIQLGKSESYRVPRPSAGKAKRIAVARAEAAAVEGEAEAEKDQRIGVKSANAEAVKGVNLAAMEIAKSDAHNL